MTVREGETRIHVLDLLPKPPHTEVAVANSNVMEEDDPVIAHLRQPRLEVMLYDVVGVVPVDVQEIDAPVGEVLSGIVERTSDQARETAVERIVMRSEIFEGLDLKLA